MEAKVIWLFVFVILYWAYCIFWGIKGALSARTASDYFIAGRRISLWVFVLAATATSFSGWTFMGHPGLIYRDGFQYAYASFYTITIPFTGVLFLKRQWIIGKRFGFITPGEMLSYYFRSDVIRLLVILVALVFSVPYLGVQLRASGFLFNVLTDGRLSVDVGMWILSAVVFIYVASGGLRAVAYVDTLQCILLAAGIVIIGVIALEAVGGWHALNDNIAALTQLPGGKTTPDGYSSYVAIPGVIQFVSSGPKAEGGAWTGVMVLTYMFALMGIQSSPAFSMWAFSNHNPAPFAPQQVWGSSFAIGLILFFFTAMQGIGGHFLGADLKFAAQYPERVATAGAVRIQGNLLETDYRSNAQAKGLNARALRPIGADALTMLGQTKAIPTLGRRRQGDRPGRAGRGPADRGHRSRRQARAPVAAHAGQPGRPVDQSDGRRGALDDRPVVGLRARRHAVDRGRLHVDRGRHAHPRPDQALPDAERRPPDAEAVRADRGRRDRAAGAGGRHAPRPTRWSCSAAWRSPTASRCGRP